MVRPFQYASPHRAVILVTKCRNALFWLEMIGFKPLKIAFKPAFLPKWTIFAEALLVKNTYNLLQYRYNL